MLHGTRKDGPKRPAGAPDARREVFSVEFDPEDPEDAALAAEALSTPLPRGDRARGRNAKRDPRSARASASADLLIDDPFEQTDSQVAIIEVIERAPGAASRPKTSRPPPPPPPTRKRRRARTWAVIARRALLALALVVAADQGTGANGLKLVLAGALSGRSAAMPSAASTRREEPAKTPAPPAPARLPEPPPAPPVSADESAPAEPDPSPTSAVSSSTGRHRSSHNVRESHRRSKRSKAAYAKRIKRAKKHRRARSHRS